MNNLESPGSSKRARRFIGQLLSSPIGAKITNFGPIAWIIRLGARRLAQSQIGTEAATYQASDERIAYTNLDSTLKSIVVDVVETFGYVGAMVATYEPEGALPVRAWHVSSQIASENRILAWEAQLAAYDTNRQVSLSDPAIARVYVNRREDRENLGVQAFLKKRPVVSNELFDLFRPIVSEGARAVVQGIQEALSVQQVIAVPFFLETQIEGISTRELVGNLFALANRPIEANDQYILTAFGRQTAAAILSERRRLQTQAVLRLIFDIQTNLSNESLVLKQIVRGVVNHLGYVGALVATYEADDSLPVRAWYVDPSIATTEQIETWEQQISQLNPERPVSLTNPNVAKIYVDNSEYRENLSVKAFAHQGPVTSSDMFDLFRPIVPDGAKPAIQGIQEALDVSQVIAVPFFLDTTADGMNTRQFVGNLFALSRADSFSSSEIEILQAFGQQAAAGLHNARLYRQAEDRRKASEIFGKMAFSASASVHDLKNKIGIIRGNLQVLKILPVEQLHDVVGELTEPVFRNLDLMADALETMHEPWHQVPDTMISINNCLQKAVVKLLPTAQEREQRIRLDMALDLPEIRGSFDMMVEAFQVLLKNANEAISTKVETGRISIVTACRDGQNIEVSISDNGIGIKPEHLGRIFEMSWSTKRGAGLGFGLFWTRDYIIGLGGTISVKSAYGDGTTFSLTIPVVQQLDAPIAPDTDEPDPMH